MALIRGDNPASFSSCLAQEGGLAKHLNLSRLLRGHLLNELLDGGGRRLSNLNKLHAPHNSAGRRGNQSPNGRNRHTASWAEVPGNDARMRQRHCFLRVACALMNDISAIDQAETEIASPIVVLAGFMGSGKTTTGQALAGLLRWAFVDLDEWIEREQQTSIRDLFQQIGEAGFRQIEHRALGQVIAACSRATVVALGGGTFAQASNDEVFRRAGLRTVFLKVPLEIMLARCWSTEEQNRVRPLAADPEQFKRLYESRLPSYRRADVIIEAGDKGELEVARLVGAALSLKLVNDQ